MKSNSSQQKGIIHLNHVTVSQEALMYNHLALQKAHPEAKVCPVLKSNAYGHGLAETAPIFDSMDCQFLVVNSLSEAKELYSLKVKTPILIMGYTPPGQLIDIPSQFQFALFDLEEARALNNLKSKTNIHIFVNTGMNREGVQIDKLEYFLAEIKKLKNLTIVGLCSHFADADNSHTLEFCNYQMGQYDKALEILKQNGISPIWKHLSASGGAYKFYSSKFNMVRAGIAHYGYNPLEKGDEYEYKIILRPALEFVSTLVRIENVKKGQVVGYGCTHTFKAESVLGLIPAGYFEGIERRFSNNGFVKIRDQFFPIVGRVSMNMTSIDITGLQNPKVGEKVVIYSSNSNDKNSIENAAHQIGVIPYELIVHIAESIPRIVI
jgi:alanine racemase